MGWDRDRWITGMGRAMAINRGSTCRARATDWRHRPTDRLTTSTKPGCRGRCSGRQAHRDLVWNHLRHRRAADRRRKCDLQRDQSLRFILSNYGDHRGRAFPALSGPISGQGLLSCRGTALHTSAAHLHGARTYQPRRPADNRAVGRSWLWHGADSVGSWPRTWAPGKKAAQSIEATAAHID